jgi:hypothetical protein
MPCRGSGAFRDGRHQNLIAWAASSDCMAFWKAAMSGTFAISPTRLEFAGSVKAGRDAHGPEDLLPPG